jgi:hypothetical protein
MQELRSMALATNFNPWRAMLSGSKHRSLLGTEPTIRAAVSLQSQSSVRSRHPQSQLPCRTLRYSAPVVSLRRGWGRRHARMARAKRSVWEEPVSKAMDISASCWSSVPPLRREWHAKMEPAILG